MEVRTDQALAAAAQRGDLNAEEELLRRYKQLVKNKANMYYMVGADEDDVVQEGMIGLLKAVRRYDSAREASFQTFAGVCITTQIISAIRASQRNRHKALNTSVSLDSSVREAGSSDQTQSAARLQDTLTASPADSPEQMLVFKDITECILRGDEKIFSRYEMQVLTLLLRGRTRREIAAELGRPLKSIDNCLGRAKKKIISYLMH